MRAIIFVILIFSLTSCGFHPRGKIPLAEPLHYLYLKTPDPYGQLTRNLRVFLKISGVHVTASPQAADSILSILSESTQEQLIGINGTQDTRQYNLILTVIYTVLNKNQQVIVFPQTATETRTLTIKAGQMLAGSSEAKMLYQQMRQAIVYDILNRLSSKDVTKMLLAKPNEN